MSLLFLGGPVRTARSRAFLESLAAGIKPLGYEIWVPHQRIGLVRRGAADVSRLARNFWALRACQVAVFLLDAERTGTGIELGYLHALIESGASRATLVGFVRKKAATIDLMSRLCISRGGRLARGARELARILTELAPRAGG